MLPAERIRKAARGLATMLTSSVKVNAVVTLARSHPKIAAAQEQFDRDNWLLNTRLGAVNLRTGEVREHRRDDYCTKITPVGPVKMGNVEVRQVPTPDHGLGNSTGSLQVRRCVASVNEPNREIRQDLHDKEVEGLVEYLLRLYGYCLTGDVRAHILILEIGEGGNGKGVLNDLMSVHVFGQRARDGYCCEMPMEALIAPKGGERHPTELMDLWHSRLAIARESEKTPVGMKAGSKNSPAVIPSRPVTCGKTSWNSTPPTSYRIWSGQAHLARRISGRVAPSLHLIPFPQRFAHVADPNKHVLASNPSLIDELVTEAPGVLFKLIAALADTLKKRDFKIPATVAAARGTTLFTGYRRSVARRLLRYDQSQRTHHTQRTLASWQPWAKNITSGS